MADGKIYQKNEVIFEKGDAGSSMYCVESGTVGVYDDYGKPDQVMIAKLGPGSLFGEMSLLEHEPRSATIVVLEEAVISEISEETFHSYFEQSPEVLISLAEQMSHRLRKTTKKYLEACQTVNESVKAEKAGGQKGEGLLAKIKELCEEYVRSLRSA